MGVTNGSVYYTDFAIKAFRTYLCMMIFACVNKVTFIFLQAIGAGIDGVLYSVPVSNIPTAVISVVLIARIYKQLSRAKSEII